ncbi:MAG: crotonase/enoyl-CoA hydratase family protein [Burkholderiaceae bacterium]|nr:crotonase/enoyl-CoA hydratase family protein [Burkholderiaceae bacterium]MCD8517311.1 crotonase/enoyl-CoA hydratase family protein [Burkholderiaceae bacterium]MCD8537612.1 crotonase/enoyl-CoA hydratase family protein [Burkholderiaceae bacterium]MCD8566010.1 crotonase/enoyl-CoA hydratase family protein [Burkholderiaceae bacterium]
MTEAVLLQEVDEHGVMTLTLNHEPTRNALTGTGLTEALLGAFARIEHDRGIKVLILTARGKVFSSGGKIDEMARQIQPEVSSAALRQEYRHGIQRLPLALYQLEVPTIAAVNGMAIGAGCDLACMCDIRLASETASFAESFVKVGIIPGDGGAWFLPRIVGMARAVEMSMTGEPIDAQTALQWGLVSRVVPDDQLLPTALEVAHKMTRNSPDIIRMTKRLLREGQNSSLSNLLELSAAYQAIAHKTPEHAVIVQDFMDRKAQKKT